MAANLPTPMETFLERVKAKLRDDIGSLLPEEAVADMVKRVVEDEFFTKTQKNVGTGYNPVYKPEPSAFQAMVIEAFKPIMEKHALIVAERHAADIEAHIKQTVEAGLMAMALKSLDKVFADALEHHAWNIQNVIENNLRAKGLVR
mgnify:CR=1 FL=1